MATTWYEKGLEEGLEKGMEQGLEKGMEQGLEKGMEQGLEKGRELGVTEGQRQVVAAFLQSRFGPLSEEQKSRLDGLSLEQLLRLLDQAATAQALGDIPFDQL